MRFKRRFSLRKRRPSVWLALCNFQADSPATADRLTFPFSAALASGTRVGLAATLLTSSGIQLLVGGESGKTRRIVGDVKVSALTTAGGTIADAFVREAIMVFERDASGAILAQNADLFSNAVLSDENILQMRETYFGSVDTTGGVVHPDNYDGWWQEAGLQRWDTKVTRRLTDNTVLMYVVCIKKLAIQADPTAAFTISGALRAIISR